METVSENTCFGGVQGVYTHRSSSCACDMTFGLFLPEEARDGPVPLLWYLSGLTCTHENAMTKAGAQAWAAEQGIGLVFPDTSPRGDDVADDDAYDLGKGAGFYVNATRDPWAPHYRMWDYIAEELPTLLERNFSIDPERQSITGHSMGGHGALTIAIKNQDKFKCCSAFAPICNPTQCPWGQKAFPLYLGDDKECWKEYDSVELIKKFKPQNLNLLVHQGTADCFIESQLHPGVFKEACEAAGVPLEQKIVDGYDHNFYFIATFIDEHLEHHAKFLGCGAKNGQK